MLPEINAGQVIERMKRNLGVQWRDSGTDMFYAGRPDTRITGIATAWTPSLEVLRRATDANLNMIISRESPYWLHDSAAAEFSGAGAPFKKDQLLSDPTYKFKQEFIANKNLVIYRFRDNWDARGIDGQLRALASALGWANYQIKNSASSNHSYFDLPAGQLDQLVASIEAQLKIRAMRVLGDPQSQIRKVALTHGFLLVPALAEVLQAAGVDAVVTGEPVEWEALPYFEDWISAGKGKAMIILGHEASEEPGSGEVAAWMKSFLTDIPVKWLPAGEPFWSGNFGDSNPPQQTTR